MKEALFKNVTQVTVCGISPGQEKLIDLDEDDLAGDAETRQAIKEKWLVASYLKLADSVQLKKSVKECKLKGDVKNGIN